MASKKNKKAYKEKKYTFLTKTFSEPKINSSVPDVKWQFKNTKTNQNKKTSNSKNADDTAKDNDLPTLKKDVAKSLFVVSLILALELVVYFLWR